VKKVLELLDIISNWIDDIPPAANAQRFGNKAFRIWLNKVEEVGNVSTYDIWFVL
jgi:serine/threonine-protein phosphatase 2A activator